MEKSKERKNNIPPLVCFFFALRKYTICTKYFVFHKCFNNVSYVQKQFLSLQEPIVLLTQVTLR